MGKKIRTYIALFFTAAATVCLSLGLAACSGGEKDNKDAGVYNVGEEGIYYYDAGASEYLMTLQSGVYMISVGGSASSSGTYSCDEESGTITFTPYDGEAFMASLSDGAMKLDIGTAYTFLKKVNYDVTFMSGSETVDSQSVTYGKAAEAVDGEKDGYIFLGWYADPDFTTKYSFDSAVTGDVTLYARYVELDSTIANFDVTFIADGEVVYETKTQNGVVYDIPDYKGILGWWVSDTNSGDALTYKYDGEILTEATKLFAVKEGALGASVYGDKVTWEGSSSSVTITVDGTVVTSSAANGSYAYDFSSLSTGSHEITLSASGYRDETLVYVAKRLDRVSNFSVYGDVLVYNAVENAQYYCVSVTCGNASHEHEMVYNGNTLTYDFSDCEMGPEGISFTVYAYAQGYVESVSETFVYALILDGTTVAIDEATDTATWTSVSGATGYEVYVNGELAMTTTDTEYSFKNEEKGTEIEIAVKPVAPGYYSEISGSVNYTKSTLKAPEIISVSGYEISWEKIDGAASYELNINGYLVTVEPKDDESEAPTTYVISDTDLGYIFSDARNAISVTAIAENPSENSQQGDITYMTDAVMSSALSYADGVITWDYALAANSYTIELDGSVVDTVSSTNTYDIIFTHSGESGIKVYFDDSSFASLTVYTYAVIFDAQGGNLVDTVYVAKGDALSLPTPSYDGAGEFLGWYTLPNPDGRALEEYTGDGTEIESGYVFDRNSTLILYACWEVERRNVSLDLGGFGELESAEFGMPVDTEKYTVPVPSSTDAAFVFVGWYSGANGKGTRYTDENGNSLAAYTETDGGTVYAFWAEVLKFTETTSSVDGSRVLQAEKGDGIDYVSSVTVPAEYNGMRVANLGSSAFKNSPNLTKIYLPDTMEYVSTVNNGYDAGTGAFAKCAKLSGVFVYETGEPGTDREIFYYSDDAGALFRLTSEGEAELIYYPYARTGAYVTPEVVYNSTEFEYVGTATQQVYRSVTSIAVQVFSGNTKLTAVTISATVDTIESQAFYKCTNLKKVTFSDYVTDENAAAASSLSLGSSAFQGCGGISEITLPARYTEEFKTSVFSDCSSLENVYVSTGNATYTSVDGMLCDATGGVLLWCPAGRGGDVTINGGILEIGESAFASNKNMTGVTIPGSVTEIGKNAFKGCTGVEYVVFEGDGNSGDLAIRESAFYGLTSTKFTEVELPSNLVRLEVNAFGGCTHLTTVTVHARTGTDTIDFAADAFGSTATNTAYTVTVLYLDRYVPEFAIADVFGKKLEHVYIEEGNGFYWSDENGVVYNKDVTSLIYYPLGLSGDYLAMPETVTTIGANMFEGRTALTGIYIPKSVVTIGENAFYGCTKLTYVTFEEGGEEALEIREYAFRGCTRLTSVSLPEHTEAVGDHAFDGCTSLTYAYLPSTLMYLGGYDSDGKLVSMNVFGGCTELEKIDVSADNTSFMAIDGILYARDASGNPSELIICPASCAVKDIVIETTVTYIWDRAFYGNKGVETVSFAGEITPGVDREFFGESVFEGATGLRTVELPAGLTSIPESLFYRCTGLEEVVIPYTVSYIGGAAFMQCTSLTTVTFEGTPAGVAEAALVFGDCETSGNNYHGTFTGCESLTEIVLPERTTTLGRAMFAGYSVSSSTVSSYSALEKVTIGRNVTSIPDYAFMGADRLTTVTFEEGSALTSIGTYAFGYSGSVSGLVIPDGVTKMGSYAFRGSKVTDLTLPAGITEIPGDCFRDCQSLVGIVIPKNVESLTTEATSGSGAFYQCYSLESVTFEKGSKLEEIGMYCFWFCTSLKSIEIPSSVRTIEACAFWNCTALGSITFEEGTGELASIGVRAFAYTPITEFEFPETTAKSISLGTELFVGCTRLTSVTLSNGITDLGTALSKCNTIKSISFNTDSDGNQTNKSFAVDDSQPILYSYSGGSVVLVFGEIEGEFTVPYYVKTIEANAFANQVSLTRVYIPTSITEIDDGAFSSCTSLTDVVFYTATYELNGVTVTVPAASSVRIGDYAFSNCSSITEINLSGDDVIGLDGTTVLKGINVKQTGKGAFSYCTSLKKVTMPYTVDGAKSGAAGYMATYAFAYDPSLTEIVFTEDTTYLANYTFYYCTGLKSVSVPSTVTSLGQYVFSYSGLESADLSEFEGQTVGYGLFDGCASLKTVVLGDALASVNQYVFRNCTALESLVLPAGVTKIVSYAFYGDTNLSKVAKTEEELRAAEEGRVDLSSVTSLGGDSFYNCASIKTVILSEELTELESETFYGCVSLESIDLSNITDMSYKSAFYGCTSLKAADLSSLSGVLGVTTFYGCESLEYVLLGTKITAIGKYNDTAGVFQNSGLKRITYVGYDGPETFALPTGLELIGPYAFASTSLESVVVPNLTYSSTSRNNKLGAYMFQYCELLTSVSFEDGAETVGERMFLGCTALTYVELPGTVNAVLGYAFQNSGLKSIDMPGVETIGTYAFYGCAFETVKLGSGITSAGSYMFAYNMSLKTADLSDYTGASPTLVSYAFYHCESLETVTFPATGTMTAVGSYSFGYCTSLESLTLPANITSFASQSFMGCSSLESIDLSHFTVTSIPKECFSGCTSLALITIPEKVTTVAESAFSGCASLESVTFAGDAVTTLDKTSFAGCTSLKEILIPESVTKINAGAFMNSGLESVTIPAGVTTIGDYAFSGCTFLSDISVDASNPKYQVVEGFLCDTDGGIVFCPESLLESGELVIPEGLTLGSYVFAYSDTLKSVVIPGSVGEIPSYAFAYSSGLETVTISEGVTSVADRAFDECPNLREISFPDSLKSVGGYAFYKDESLLSVTLPEGLESVGSYAFAYCYGLTYAYVPSTLTEVGGSVFRYDSGILEAEVMCGELGEYMFRDCTSLCKVTLSEDIAGIPTYAFSGTSLAEINTLGRVTEIGSYAFEGCSLVSVTLPDTVVSVDSRAFQGCACLEKVNLPASLTTIGSYAFDGCSSLDKAEGGEGLVEIGNYAFRNTGLMDGFALSSKIKTIGDEAFKNSGLSCIVLYEATESIGKNAFTGWEASQTIFVECSYYAAFNTWGDEFSSSASKFTNLLCFEDCDADIVYGCVA